MLPVTIQIKLKNQKGMLKFHEMWIAKNEYSLKSTKKVKNTVKFPRSTEVNLGNRSQNDLWWRHIMFSEFQCRPVYFVALISNVLSNSRKDVSKWGQ